MNNSETISRLPDIDYDAFARDIFELKKETEAQFSVNDYRHFRKIIWINRLFTAIGYTTAWIIPNPISAYCISQGIFGRWLIMHHVSHGCYDRVPGVPKAYTSKVFAQGWRRFYDWFDWIHPAAWHYEHNILHHLNTNESIDPDLVEDHTEFLRRVKLPRFLKYIFITIFCFTWKFLYYAPNTLRALDSKDKGNHPDDSIWKTIFENGFDPRRKHVQKLWLTCYLPYVSVSFIIIPACFLMISPQAALFVLINRVIAELMTNFHSFFVIGPNHSGDDIYRFDYHFKGKGEFAVNQVISACNYHTGTETKDYLQIWLNYQIEHHLYPRFPMIKYREVQPKVKAICEKHNVPYIQQHVLSRFKKLISVFIGTADMKWLHSSPLKES
ncbi:fatty acid desaturase [bacterium AH-315-E10]|nr:fatty acid desaturase [bacterium AH-315-E10]